jgi:hypothetical protein
LRKRDFLNKVSLEGKRERNYLLFPRDKEVKRERVFKLKR